MTDQPGPPGPQDQPPPSQPQQPGTQQPGAQAQTPGTGAPGPQQTGQQQPQQQQWQQQQWPGYQYPQAVPPPNATSGWYSGPLPIAGLAPKETIGAAIGRTAVKAITALIILGGGLILLPVLLIVALTGGGDSDGGGGPSTAPTVFEAGTRNADIRLVSVPVTGLILGQDRGGGGLFGPSDITYGYTVKEQLATLARRSSVDGIILEVDSPGGTIFGSKAIADGVADYQAATGKPVIAYVSGISASGGVYAMAGSDEIYADHGTLVGSIGVIFGPFSRYNNVVSIDGGLLGGGVTTEDGIEVEFLTAGRSKDFGNPYRAMTIEERTVLQEGLDDAYAEFVGHVSVGRDIPEADIEKDLGALIFGEQQAVANGLIDGVANREAIYVLAAEAAGLGSGETWRVDRIEPPPTGFLEALTGSADATGDQGSADLGSQSLRTNPLCLGSAAILAYHGDPAALCR